MRPHAYVSPAAMRATRALLRRRRPLTRPRAELRAPLQQTHSQYPLPEMGTKLADKANRDGVGARCAAPAVPQRVEGARARLGSDDQWRSAVALPSGQTATPHAAPPWSRRPAGPGRGKILRVGLRYDHHDMRRFPRGQACVASCRLGTGAQAAAGKR